MKSSILIVVSIVLFMCFTACKQGNQSQMTKINDDRSDAFGLKGKRLTSLDSLLLGDDKKARMFFLYNYYDCNSCIDSGYQLVKRIDGYFGRKYVPVISSMGSPSHAQIRNEYVEYVYNDVNDLIRKELKYIQTPIVISIDKNNVILDYIFPNVSDEDEYNRFLSFMDNVSTNYR